MHPIDWPAKRAVIFDLDGTLYLQKPVRRAMLLRLLRAHALRPAAGYRTVRFLQAYRHAQEDLRGTSARAADQIRQACARTSMDHDRAAALVDRWMDREPLDVIRAHGREGLVETLGAIRSTGRRLGLLSDYPAAAKLEALHVLHLFDVIVSAQDPDVGEFKPSPRGIEVVLGRLDVSADEAVYVGDRPDVDLAAASAAGVDCALFAEPSSSSGYVPLRTMSQLGALLS